MIAKPKQALQATDAQSKTALRVILRILDRWECSETEKQALLGIGRSTLRKYQAAPEIAKISPDLLERLSYLLNIHQALRTMFENPENVERFVRLPNLNPFFNGKTPMDLMSTGRMAHLYEVARHIDAMRGDGG